jgi:polysaccharide export outer membrane protein
MVTPKCLLHCEEQDVNTHKRITFYRSSVTPLLYLGVVLLAQMPFVGSSVAQEASDSKKAEFTPREPRYKLGLGDVFEIQFPLVPEFNQVVTIQPDGFVPLKSTADLHVQGLTTPEVVDAIKAAYKGILNEPIVTITLKEFQKPYFTAWGKVNKPGKYDLRGDTRLTEAIALAGGFDDAAKHSQVLLFRKMDDDRIAIRSIDIKKMLSSGKMDEDIYLRSGDMIMVPKSLIAKLKPWIPSSSLGMFMSGY